jgi:cell shape-determining protein MreC
VRRPPEKPPNRRREFTTIRTEVYVQLNERLFAAAQRVTDLLRTIQALESENQKLKSMLSPQENKRYPA